MLLKGKKMAFLGLLLSITLILIILSGVFEFNTLFLIGAASFCVGIALREYGMSLGIGFYIASIILGLLLAPNKLYMITYGAMGLYIVGREFAWTMIDRAKKKNPIVIYWVLKYVIFNLIYIPIIIFMPKLIYQGTINTGLTIMLIIGGQALLFVLDKTYDYFQVNIWGKMRSRLE
ncbi:MAG TPA: hypothetical protein GXZ21_11325 [Clostridiales bacterium]|nr:hypothetical protein [Clostridiales bacterium]